MEQAKPQATRQHSPVWETLYAVRRQLKYAGVAEPRTRQRQEQAPAHASAAPARKPPPPAQADTKVGYWARERERTGAPAPAAALGPYERLSAAGFQAADPLAYLQAERPEASLNLHLKPVPLTRAGFTPSLLFAYQFSF